MMMFRSGDLNLAVARVHARTFEAYRAWCQFVSLTPRFAFPVVVPPASGGDVQSAVATAERRARLKDLSDYFMIWSGSENLRRVSSYVCQHFHSRPLPQSAASGGAANKPKFAETNQSCQQQIEAYRLTYDDLEDVTRNSANPNNRWMWIKQTLVSPSILLRRLTADSSRCNRSRFWDNLLVFGAFPSFGGWAALARNFFWLIRFHVWIGILIVDVCSSLKFSTHLHLASTNGPAGGAERGVMSVGIVELYMHLSGAETGFATLRRLCTIDLVLFIVETLLDIACTHTVRASHALILALNIQCLMIVGGGAVSGRSSPLITGDTGNKQSRDAGMF